MYQQQQTMSSIFILEVTALFTSVIQKWTGMTQKQMV